MHLIKIKKYIQGIFAFARETPEQTGIFAINFTDQSANFELDLSNLLKVPSQGSDYISDEESNFNSICYIEDWSHDGKGDFYFVRELVQGHVTRKVEPYQSIAFVYYQYLLLGKYQFQIIE